MEYRLSGVTVDSQSGQEGFTTSRILAGKVAGKIVRASGRVSMQSGIRADIRIRLESGHEKKEIPLTIEVGAPETNWREFDLSIPVSSDAANLSIEMLGSYNGTQRRLLLTGTFFQPEAPGVPLPVNKPPNDATAAQELADMVLWWETQPWVKALKKSMPRGVTVGMHAEPYDAEGWSEVTVREHHTPDSGFDPHVSPALGLFRVSRAGRKVEWMDPVSGEYQPLTGFIKLHELKVAPDASVSSAGDARPPTVTAGDFESKPQPLPDGNAPVIVPEPGNPKNHVARISGPEEMGFALPASVPEGTQQLTVSFRLLHPEGTKLIKFEDGRIPEGIRLRVRLLNDKGNSTIRDMVVRPTGQWRELEYVFYDLPGAVVQIGVEAIWMKGPVYVDDVKLVN